MQMKTIYFLLVLLVACFTGHLNGYSKSDYPHLSSKSFDEIAPFLIPEKHPLFERVDKLFRATRATQNSETLKSAGFHILFEQPRSFIRVVSHPTMPGYLIKLTLDTLLQKKHNMSDWRWFVRRCRAAKSIKGIIAKRKMTHFTVPDKWMYLLPSEPSPPMTEEYSRKNAILIVAKMDLVSESENDAFWKNKVTREFLRELYLIVSLGNKITLRPDNIWLTKSGKCAFVDTEYTTGSYNIRRIKRFLSQEMADYWESLL